MTQALENKMKKTSAIALAFLLAGCAARAPLNFERTPAVDPSRACFDAMKADQSYAALRAKSAGPGGPPTLEMRANKERVTEDEKLHLSRWAAAFQSCSLAGRGFREANLPPAHAAVTETFHMKVISSTARFYAGDTTWGQYLSERDAAEAESRASWAAANQTHAQAQAAQASADAARGLALMQALQAAKPPPVTYQPVPVAPLSPTINCTTSRGLGSTVNTTCR